ncbi:MAG: hypothetical protein ABI618_12830 [Nitrospirota bacterium]
MTRIKTVRFIMTWGLILSVLSACAGPSKKATDPLTPTEQLLFSSAIKKGLKDYDVSILKGASITLTASSLRVDQSLNGDVIHRHMNQVVTGWLGQQGVLIREEEKDATYRVHLILESIGTTENTRMLGLPATQATIFPIATPELALYKRVQSEGYVRFYFDIFERASGRLIRSTEPQVGSVTQTVYTAFFFFNWRKTNMEGPPPIFESN